MTIQLSDLLRQVVSNKVDRLQEERKKSMHSTSKRARELQAQQQSEVPPEVLGHRAVQQAQAQRAMELARAEREKRAARDAAKQAQDFSDAKAELERQLAADKEARLAGKPNLSRVDIATQKPEDEDDFLAPPSGMRKTRATGQDDDEREYTPDQLGSRGRLGMDESSHDSDEEHAKKLGRDIKRYEKGGKAAHKAALAAAKKREARKTGEK